ncbi:teneurin-m isoform X2 [Parasteatoda tepidariorum]|uniref:teneurin-m isoform X2 n=1 Tax=Parasteatoda tepidariorum TaxID=114398 RepID=UPI0039BC3827
MEGLAKSTRLNRQGSRVRRHRSQEWQDYSSSDNEEHHHVDSRAYRYPSTEDTYEDQRGSESRKLGLERGRGRGNGSGRSYSHSSMELLTGRNYFSGSDGELEVSANDIVYPPGAISVMNSVTPTSAPGKYNAYGSLPRQPNQGGVRDQSQVSNKQNQQPQGGRESRSGSTTGLQGNNANSSKGRMSLSLRRGPSSSSTSDNNSDATFTDTEFNARRQGGLQSQSVFGESPPEPAPPAVPPRSMNGMHPMEALGRRARLGYLESECESEPPYLPTMLTSTLNAYASQDLNSNPNLSKSHIEDASENSSELISSVNRMNSLENERIYSPPQQTPSLQHGDLNSSKPPNLPNKDIPIGSLHSSTTVATTISATTNNSTSSSNTGATYSNPIPVFCSTPSSTTGPMVPITNCVNPQLIQPPTAPPTTATRRPFKATSAFSATAAMASSRFHFRKNCSRKCTWKIATFALAFVTIVLSACVAYFAAVGGIDEALEGNSPCIVVEDGRHSGSGSTGTPLSLLTKDVGRITLPQPICTVVPRDISEYEELPPGNEDSRTLQPQESWNTFFSHPEASFVRLNFSMPHNSRLALLARKNEPPSITSYDIMEVIGDEMRRYVRAALPRQEISFLHFLEPGTWYFSIINDDSTAIGVSFQPSLARDVPTSCPNNCHHHGNCHLGKCHCFPGYIGHDCADSVCPVHCNGHGRYVQGICRCETGWKGAECNVPVTECEVMDCNNQGFCVGGKCQCRAGYKGHHCEEVDCLDPSCTGHGACVNGQCWCKTGWRGVNCSEADNRLSRCFPDCSKHGVYDLETESCICFDHWAGSDCSRAKCGLDCGNNGQCEEGRCRCDPGWSGARCDQKTCDNRCHDHGQCKNGTCVCVQGWMGTHCTLEGCPDNCGGVSKGQCVQEEGQWSCRCEDGWGGSDCKTRQETSCIDDKDNDQDGLVDCADSECCIRDVCKDSLMCLSAPDPLDILLRKQPPAVTATFYQKMKFLIEEDSVQSYAHRDEYSESRVSVARGQVINKEGTGLIGVRVSVATDPQFGFTLTRPDGWFDILVNGGSAVTLQFQRNPFHPIKRTVLVPWNDIVVMQPVVMSAVIDPEPVPKSMSTDACHEHDYDYMKPIVYQTWRPVSEGGCTENSAVIAETQVLQESLSIPGSDLHLVYHSSHAHGYLSTIHLQLTPSNISLTLRLVHLHIIIEGIFFERIFEADPDIKFTYAWSKRNVYKQKVYGLTTARVFVGYDYINCPGIIWTSHSMTIKGYDMETSELGGWNLDIHHRYNFHEGVLQKGDGTTIYFKQQPRVITALMGTGHQRPMLCPECNGIAKEARLLAPVALTSGPDGSVYVGDFNLIRRITPNGQVYTVFRMRTTDMSTHYHITLSPTDGHLYISDPERHQILRIHSLDKVEDLESNFDVVVGSGDRCLPRDRDNCGDGKPALEARLSYPKGMAVAVDNRMYFADGSNIRMVDSRGIIHTMIGDHHHKRQWRPIPCTGTLKIEEAKLRWPTDLAINPLDNSLYFIDDHMVLKLTQDQRVMVIAGHPVYCRPQNNRLKSRITGGNLLWSLIGFTFSPTGTMYLAEVDSKNVHRIRMLTSDGELLHFAGREGVCDCDWQNCTCSSREEGQLAVDTRLLSVTSITVTGDGVVHIADQGNLKILSAIPYLPIADSNQEFQISFPEHHEIYVFNKYGQHITTKNILTGRTVYNFHYNVNTSFGKLSAVTDASGNKIAFLRDQGNSLHTIETARGQKCRVQMGKQSILEVFVDPDNMETVFDYDSNGLLTSRSDAAGRSFFYVYDENGRLTQVVKPSGQETVLTFDLGPDGASVIATDQNKGEHSMVTVKGNTVVSQQGPVLIKTTIHQDGVIEVETPWQQGLVWESVPHPVLMGTLPVQAGMFPVPLRLTSFDEDDENTMSSWNYDIKYNRKDKEKTIAAVERVLVVNETQILTVEYDWVAGREILYNSSRRPFLVVQYDGFSRPVQWLPTDTRLPLNLMYERLGRLSGWQQGSLSETYSYDRMGHLTEIKNPDVSAMKFSYDLKTMPAKISLPSGRKFTYHYDENGGLKYVTTPKGTRHTFTAYVSIGFYKLLYTPPGNTGSYVVHFNDQKLPLLKTYPGDLGRALYCYDNRMMLTSIVYGGGKIERNYSAAGFINYEAWRTQDVDIISEFQYKGASLARWRMKFNSPFPLTNAVFTYTFDGMQRLVLIVPKIGNMPLQPLEFSTNMTTGRKEQIGPFRCYERFHNESVVSDGVASITRQVDPLYRLKFLSIVISDKEVYRVDMQYDNRNAVTQSKIFMKHLGVSKVRVQNYSYDEDGQLVEMVGRDHWKFHYDQNGNMVTMQYMGNKIDILHDNGDRIVSFGETPYVLDGRGFVTQRGEERFVYNTKRQLTRAFRIGRYDIDYYYDGRGRLSVRKDNVGNVTQFFYAHPEDPYAVTHIYNNADGRTITLMYDDRKYPMFILLNKESFYIATDHTGSPLLVYDVYGDVVKEIHRGPYGHVLFDSNPNFYLPVDFQGGLLDPMTGLIHFGDRVYDSLVGQWMTPGWNEILKSLSNPKRLHLYRFNENDPVNINHGLQNKLDLKGWIRYQGINLDTLDLAANEIYNRSPYDLSSIDFEPLHLDLPTVPLISGLTCSVQQKLLKFARLTSVQKSKVKTEQLFDPSLPKISTLNVPFGKGITVSNVNGRAVVRASARAEIIRKDVFSAVFNNCHILDLHLSFHGQDVFYLVKDNTRRVGDDLNQLQRLGNSAVNTTVHESKLEEGEGHAASNQQHQVDVRIHSNHAILNIRYGTTAEKERQRLLRHAKRQAVSQRWSQERDIISSNQRGPLKWTEREKEQILSTGFANGYRGEYYHDVNLYPELADDPSNVVFHKNNEKHRKR